MKFILDDLSNFQSPATFQQYNCQWKIFLYEFAAMQQK
ncbi:hypothetical protein MIZ03_2765 [Rhodoferax lithotrophicus]|uniref:Uncharacterized protein n=1 Tax=Rhodoferax lithotrophicus TaxID=2798804 RepID=A0ABN6DA93_9BURK|nr:hypothetical protein MIZ03_2765 [Rhodoferax sp. MIZ03]